MTVENIFEYAARNKVRFPYKGLVSVEDLWDLPATELDKIFKTLNSQAKQAQEESLLNTKSKEDEAIEIQIAVVKHIVSVKLEERNKREKALENKAKKQKIMEIMAAKKDEALQNSPIDELQKMLDELGD
ncbi:MAG: hypothetical protein K1W19_08430 [Lachnospiraceae bacterium]